MKYILIHGIGNKNDENYGDAWGVENIIGIPREDVVAFYYEDLMDDARLHKFLKFAARASASYYTSGLGGIATDKLMDYLDDIFVFFFSKKTRDKIEERLDTTFDILRAETDYYTILGHSLGSIIGLWFLKRNPQHAKFTHLVTLGSPLGSPFLQRTVRRFIDVEDKDEYPKVRSWKNVHSILDPLSGDIDFYGFDPADNISVDKSMVFHSEVDEYVEHWFKTK